VILRRAALPGSAAAAGTAEPESGTAGDVRPLTTTTGTSIRRVVASAGAPNPQQFEAARRGEAPPAAREGW